MRYQRSAILGLIIARFTISSIRKRRAVQDCSTSRLLSANATRKVKGGKSKKSECNKKGEWGKIKKARIQESQIGQLNDPSDREILSLLIGGREAYWSSYSY